MTALPAGADRGPDPTGPVALHPERTDDPGTLRWRVAGPSLDGVTAAAVRELAGRTGGADLLAAVTVAPHHVLTTLAPGRSWADDGPTVRTAVRGAVRDARAAASATPDVALERAARRVVDEVAPYAAGHGGRIDVVSVRDGVVELDLRGACHGCPAAAFTVQGRVARRLREEAPWLVEVTVVDGPRARRP